VTIFSKSAKQPKEMALSFLIQFLVVFPEWKKREWEYDKKISDLPLRQEKEK